jgi:hypothetical protein
MSSVNDDSQKIALGIHLNTMLLQRNSDNTTTLLKYVIIPLIMRRDAQNDSRRRAKCDAGSRRMESCARAEMQRLSCACISLG